MSLHSKNDDSRFGQFLLVAVLLVAIAGILAGLAPTDFFRSVAEVVGHAEDFTRARLVRFRGLAVGLGVAWVVLATLGLTIGRTRVRQTMAALRRDLSVRRRLIREGTRKFVSRGSWAGWLLLVCVAAGAAFRIYHLDQPIKYDEAHTYLLYARRPLYQGMLDFHVPNNHLLHTLLAHVSLRVLGDHEWSLRVPALLAGLLVIGVVYRLGKATACRGVGLLAAAMTAASATQISYSANARGYTLVCWLGLVFAYRLMLALRRDRPLDWLGAGTAAALGFFTVPTMLFCFAGVLGWASWQVARGRRGSVAGDGVFKLAFFIAVVGIITLTLYSPAFAFSGLEAFRHEILRPHELGRLMGRLFDAWRAAAQSWAEGIAPTWVLVLLAGVGLVAMFWKRGGGRLWSKHAHASVGMAPVGGVWLAMFLATGVLMLLTRQAPPPRVFTLLAPYFYLFVAAGVWFLVQLALEAMATTSRPREAGTSWAAVVLSLLLLVRGGVYVASGRIFNHTETGGCPAARPAVAWLNRHAPDADRLLAPLGCDVPVLYYLTRSNSPIRWMGTPEAGETVYLLAPLGRRPERVLTDPVLLPLTKGVSLASWQRKVDLEAASLWESDVALTNVD